MNIILSTGPLLKCIYVLYIYNKNRLEWHTIILDAYSAFFQAPPSFCCLQYGKEGKVRNFFSFDRKDGRKGVQQDCHTHSVKCEVGSIINKMLLFILKIFAIFRLCSREERYQILSHFFLLQVVVGPRNGTTVKPLITDPLKSRPPL